MSMFHTKQLWGKPWLAAVVALLLMAATVLPGCTGKTSSQEITLGALVARTGDLASSGESVEAALELAVQDINEYLSDIVSPLRVKLIVEDTGTDPALALEKLKALAASGAKLVIGPQSSAELEAVKAYADEKGILLISADSTAPSLAVAGDNVFRFALGDSLQAEVVADLLWKDGIRAVVAMHRGDVWGDDLAGAIKDRFEQRGGAVPQVIRYSPDSRDFSKELGLLGASVSEALKRYGPGAVAVSLASFEEAATVFVQAQADPVLSSVRWYGSDGFALSQALTRNTGAARFAIEVGLVSPVYGGDVGRQTEVEERVRARIGRQPGAFALAAYDAAWVAALAGVTTSAGGDPATLKKALVRTANFYVGVTGDTDLDDAGDRKFGDFAVWALGEQGGAFQWKMVANYGLEPDWQGWEDDSDALAKVSALAALADSRISGYLNALKTLAVTEEVQSGDWQAMKPLLEKVVQAEVAAAVWYVLPDGSYYSVAGGKQSANLSDRSYFAPLMAGNTVVGDLVISRSTGRKSAIAVVPVMKDGEVVGGLGSSIFLDDLSNALRREMALPDDMVFYAVAAAGEVALHSDTANILADRPQLPKRVNWQTSSLTGWRFALGFK